MISFTGSARVGWMIRQRAPMKRVALELGGNAAVLVEPDADLDRAVARCVYGGYTYSGQSCISTQRILVHEWLYDRFRGALRGGGEAASDRRPARRCDRRRPHDRRSQRRAGGGVDPGSGGGRRPARGRRKARRRILEPAVLLDTTSEMKVNCEELFAPATTVRRYSDFDAASPW